MGIFSILHTGTTGLNAAQVAVATTSQNIANADNDSYTRQRVQLTASNAVTSGGVSIGTGVTVKSIVRIHDEYTYGKLRNSASDVAYDTYNSQTLKEVAGYFPDLSESGISQDIQNYFSAWNDLSTNASAGSQKIALVQSAQTMTADIKNARTSLRSLQDSVNSQLKSSVDELNSVGQQIADLNKQINAVEAQQGNYANDLRDKRDTLELSLSKLVNVSVFKGNITGDSSGEVNMTDGGTEYYLNIAGSSFIDGATFHPLVIDNSKNSSSYYSIYTEMQDGTRHEITEQLAGGKIGAMLDLRGRVIDSESNNGYPQDGTIQKYIDNMDSLAQTIITETNNIYARSAQDKMQSPNLDLKSGTSLQNAYNNIENGTFDVIVYDSAGKAVATKTITISPTTSMGDDTFSDSILTQLNSNTDDNADNNSLNDVNDYFTATFKDNGTFALTPTTNNSGYTIALVDHGTNFPGAIGVSQFLTGSDASNIGVATEYKKDPSSLQAYDAPVSGNNKVANAMVQLQYNSLNFYSNNLSNPVSNTVSGFYSAVTTTISSDTTAASSSLDTNEALYNTINTQFQSTSGVNKDEELANLIKYQSSYTAASKIITTINAMLDTLLGIKS